MSLACAPGVCGLVVAGLWEEYVIMSIGMLVLGRYVPVLLGRLLCDNGIV